MSLLGLLAAGVATVTPIDPDPDPPDSPFPWDGPTNLVVDGNSIGADFYTSIGTLDKHLMMYPPLLNSGAAHSGFAISGQYWSSMGATASDVDGAWIDGATNVLFAWETTNSTFNEMKSPAGVIADIQTYINGRRALHPGWRILIGGSIPRGGISYFEPFNTNIEAVDAHLAANWESMGADGFVNFRAAHPAFNHHGVTFPPFEAYLDFWQEKTAGDIIHLTDAGKVPIAQAVNAAIAALPA